MVARGAAASFATAERLIARRSARAVGEWLSKSFVSVAVVMQTMRPCSEATTVAVRNPP